MWLFRIQAFDGMWLLLDKLSTIENSTLFHHQMVPYHAITNQTSFYHLHGLSWLGIDFNRIRSESISSHLIRFWANWVSFWVIAELTESSEWLSLCSVSLTWSHVNWASCSFFRWPTFLSNSFYIWTTKCYKMWTEWLNKQYHCLFCIFILLFTLWSANPRLWSRI